MNPLERELRRRKALASRIAGAALLVCVGSAGVVAPRVSEQRQVHGDVEQELMFVEALLEQGREASRFEMEGLPRLEMAASFMRAMSRTSAT